MTKRASDPQAGFPRKSAKEHLLIDVHGRVDMHRGLDMVEICRLVLQRGHPEELRKLPHDISYFARQGGNLNATGAMGYSCLHVACMYCDTPTVRALLEAGACANILTSDGLSPLMIASATGFTKAVEILLGRQDCMPNHQQPGSLSTALHMAVRNRRVGTAALLFRAESVVDKELLDGTGQRAVDWLDAETGNAILELITGTQNSRG